MKNNVINFCSLFQIFILVFIFQLITIDSFTQNDTLFIHFSESVDYFSLNEIDSLTFYQGNQNSQDSILFWSGSFLIARYLVDEIDSLSFNYSPTIYQPLISYCKGVPFYTDIRDHIVYKTVKIGNQCWLRENLRYLPSIFQSNSNSTAEPRFYVYDYSGNSVFDAQLSQNYQFYGALYNWKAATQVCPKGWRLPTNDDWDSLKNYLIENFYNFDNSSTDNKIAKSLSGSKPQIQNGLWTNSLILGTPGNLTYELKRNISGFSILPAGYLLSSQFLDINTKTYFWSNNDSSGSFNTAIYINFDDIALNSNLMHKESALSVRCISEKLKVFTDTVTNLLQNKATLNGRLFVGPEQIIQKGFFWKKNMETVWNVEIIQNEEFSIELLNLDTSTTYHFFSFVISINDTLYGDTLTFTTYSYPICPGLPTFVDIRDNEVYSTVLIGTQCWMKENLRYIPFISSINNYESVPKYYVYGYTGNNLNEAKTHQNYHLFGVLYNWKSALNGLENSTTVPSCVQGNCPKGWHVPSQNEFIILSDFMGGSIIAGKALKSNYLWVDTSNSSNTSFFSALPGGKIVNNTFSELLNNGYFWTCTSLSTYYNHLAYNLNSSSISLDYLYEGANSSSFSLRCLKNELIMSIDSIVDITSNSVKVYGMITPGYDSTYSKGISWKLVNDTIWNSQNVGTMSFGLNILNLNPNSIYLIRCYEINANGCQYSDTITFTTAHILPSPKIPYLFYVNNNSAIIKSTIIPGTNPNFYYWFRYKDIDTIQWNYFYHTGLQNWDTIYNLMNNHSYSIQLMLVCGNDTIYSPTQYFVPTKTIPCPGLQIFIDPRDSNLYNTVFINNTCWLKENLRYLPSVVPSTSISSTIPYFYVYNFNDTNVVNAKNTLEYQTTGVLYNWAAALNGEQQFNGLPSTVQGICPDGWQLPSLSEWSKLRNYLTQDSIYYIPNCGTGSVAKALSGSVPISQGGLWSNVNSNCTVGDTTYFYKRNLTGMTFLPGGYLNYHTFTSYNNVSVFWSSSYALQSYANGCQINNSDPSFFTSMVTVDSKTGMSLRCVKQVVPIIKGVNVSNIYMDKVTINGQIVPGIYNVVTKGVKYKALNDSIWNTFYLNNDTIVEIINGLDTGMTYEFLIFAYTNIDSIYSTTFQFQTLGLKPCNGIPTIIDPRDNNIYHTIQVGNQCWIRENLRYLPEVYHPDSISNQDLRYYVYGFYQNNVAVAQLDSSYIRFGTLYNYKSIKKACPDGWHIPKINEWDTLKNQLIFKGYNYTQQFFENKIAKSLSGSNSVSNGGMWANSQNVGSPGNTDYPVFRNVSFFNFLPSGYNHESVFRGKDSISGYWIGNIPTDTIYYVANLYFDCDSLIRITSNPENAWSARCIKNINTNITVNISTISYNNINFQTSIIPGNDYLINYCIKVKQTNSNYWPITQTYDAYGCNTYITSLQPDVIYQLLIEMRTDRDTLFTDTITFATPPLPPSFSNIIFSNKEINSITISALMNSGSSTVIEKGFQYKQIDSLTWNSIYLNSDTISFDLIGLNQKQKYNLRFFVHNVDSISYSTDTVFSTLWNPPCANLPTFFDLRDSNSYRTIQIGNQCWMRENLRFLPKVYSGNINSSDSARFYVTDYYGSSVLDAKSSIYYDLYGVLYNGIAAKNGFISDTFIPITNQGICPIGWHLPSKMEFDSLFLFLKVNGYACTGLTTDNQIVKSLVSSQPQSIGGLWLNSSSDIAPGNVKYQEIRNNSGFGLLPCGTKNDYSFLSIGYLGSLWTSSIHTGNYYGYYTINSNSATPSYNSMNPKGTSNVRCVKN
jgi:uncharacterized protein (TIGR02145 family)